VYLLSFLNVTLKLVVLETFYWLSLNVMVHQWCHNVKLWFFTLTAFRPYSHETFLHAIFTLAFRWLWLKNIFLSQYLFIAILCVKMSRVNWALQTLYNIHYLRLQSVVSFFKVLLELVVVLATFNRQLLGELNLACFRYLQTVTIKSLRRVLYVV